MSKPGKWVASAIFCAVFCLVNACTGTSAQPGSTSTATPSDSPTTSGVPATPTPTPPPTATADPNIPVAARAATLEGAQEFAKYFAQQFNVAFRTADPAPIVQLSKPTCPACQGFVHDIEDMRARGGHVDGNVWDLQSSIAQSFDNVANAVVIIEVHQPPVPIRDSAGNIIGQYEEESGRFALTLLHDGSTWWVNRLQVSQ